MVVNSADWWGLQQAVPMARLRVEHSAMKRAGKKAAKWAANLAEMTAVRMATRLAGSLGSRWVAAMVIESVGLSVACSAEL